MDLSAILVPPQGLVLLDCFAARYAAEKIAHLGAPVGRNDEVDVLADGFQSSISKQAFGGRVPRGDGAVKGLGDDGVVGRFDDGAEQPLSLGVTIPFGSGLPAQPAEQMRQLGLQRDVVDEQHRQHESRRAEPVEPADIKAEIEAGHVDDRRQRMSNSQAHITTMSQTSSTECGRRHHSTRRAARLSDHTAETTPIMTEV